MRRGPGLAGFRPQVAARMRLFMTLDTAEAGPRMQELCGPAEPVNLFRD